jgi:hypothetical protein
MEKLSQSGHTLLIISNNEFLGKCETEVLLNRLSATINYKLIISGLENTPRKTEHNLGIIILRYISRLLTL